MRWFRPSSWNRLSKHGPSPACAREGEPALYCLGKETQVHLTYKEGHKIFIFFQNPIVSQEVDRIEGSRVFKVLSVMES